VTTIAYDGKILAADTMMSDGKFLTTYVHKIHPLAKGGVFAGAGTWGMVHKVADALSKGTKIEKITPKQLKDVDGIYINADGRAFYLDHSYHGFLPIEHHYCAVGSGAELATGFMAAGMSPVQAIKATAKVHGATNDLVDTYDIKRQAFKLVDFPR
jgi:20S proteasome alpha/beta subunit